MQGLAFRAYGSGVIASVFGFWVLGSEVRVSRVYGLGLILVERAIVQGSEFRGFKLQRSRFRV